MQILEKIMLFILLPLLCFSSAHALEENRELHSAFIENTQLKKIYIKTDQLILLENGMFIEVENEVFPIQFVGYDAQGYYAAPLTWECKNGHMQPLYNWPTCKRCGAGPRGF